MCVEKTLSLLGQAPGVTEVDISGTGYCLEDLVLEQGGRTPDKWNRCDRSWLSTLAHPLPGRPQQGLVTTTTELETLTIDYINVPGKQPIVIRPFSSIYRDFCTLLRECLSVTLVMFGKCPWASQADIEKQEA